MTSQIEQLSAEIDDYQAEIDRLKSQLAQPDPNGAIEFTGDAPAKLHDVYRKRGISTANVTREREALKQAIEHAAVILEEKLDRLAGLQVAVEAESRIERLGDAQKQLSLHSERIQELSAQLEAEIFAVKRIFDRANKDYLAQQSFDRANGVSRSNMDLPLVDFTFLTVPGLAKTGDRFVLGARPIDLFAAEKARQQKIRQAEGEERQAHKAKLDAAHAANQASIQRRKAEQAIEVRLTEKSNQLQGFRATLEDQKRRWSGFDNRGIEQEIARLEPEVAAIEREKAELAASYSPSEA